MTWFYIPWSCVPDTEGLPLPFDLPASRLARSATWRGKHLPRRSWLRKWNKGGWIRLLSGLTLRRSTANHGAARWISSLPDSHASHGAWLGKGLGKAMKDTTASGLTSPALPKNAKLESSSLKTSRWTLFEDQEATWRAWAIKSRQQSASVRQMLGLHTKEIGGGALLPTPAARDYKDNGKNPAELNRKTATLATHAGGQLSPTWVEWLMGLPIGWTGFGCLETELSHWQEQSRFGFLLKDGKDDPCQ